MDKQQIVQAFAPLGEPMDNQPWLDYAQYGITTADASTLVELVADESFFESEGDDSWIPLHAWRALKALMPHGLPELLGILDLLVEDDWALEEIPTVIAAAKADAIEPLFASVMDADNDELVCMCSVDCLAEIVKQQPELRSLVLDKLVIALELLPQHDTSLADIVVAALLNMKGVEAIEVIRQAYHENRVDWSICGDLEDVELDLGLRTERDTPRPRYNHLPDTVMSSDSQANDWDDAEAVVQQVIRLEPKIGRNDPCPCGSGKKYKKCCLFVSFQ